MFGLGVLPTIVLIVAVFLVFRGVAHWMYGEDDTDMHTYYHNAEYEDQLEREISEYRRIKSEKDDTTD